jgi:hypothetical protein
MVEDEPEQLAPWSICVHRTPMHDARRRFVLDRAREVSSVAAAGWYRAIAAWNAAGPQGDSRS